MSDKMSDPQKQNLCGTGILHVGREDLSVNQVGSTLKSDRYLISSTITALNPVITLNLLHPIELKPIQTWEFPSASVIRIGRAGDNDVILYSSVVSRYHVELHRRTLHWEIVNIGANGTFINDKQIDKDRLENGVTIHLANAGPKLQVFLDSVL